MEIRAKLGSPMIDENGVMMLPIYTTDKADVFEARRKFADKEVTVTAKVARKKRSLDSNAYLWVLLQRMAEKLNTSKDELYLEVLERYGQFSPVVVRPEAVARMKAEWRTVKVLGEVNVNGQTGIQMLCFYGSHGYDQSEMGALLDGVTSEAKEIGVETLPPAEVERMVSEWGK